MTDKKDPPPKGPDKRGNDSAGTKRPYATLDLKATEVRTPSGDKAQPAGDAKPAAKSSAPAAAATEASAPQRTINPQQQPASPLPRQR